MNRWLRDLILILGLAGLWGISGYAIGVAIEAMGFNDYPVGIICASINLILGMSLFLGITKDPTTERIFFEGPRPNERGRWEIGCLWAMPISLLLFGLIAWIVIVIMRFIFK
jgi:hypothetical protein